ncbi:transposase domain-containing protein, partial [Shigella flexneri]|nr:transposase domain-containing protein [Shigella flexneri]ELS5307842.1 transposase domain-containing protein [Escherichia coli]HAY6199434.1 transposase domain-containing protein [Shigella flexneri 1c]EFZ1005853.1 transposase domain-containing protein [Shigella flexneri]EHA8609064.1 transposase domain-containing protein [Shigella flexneri]
TDKTLSRKPGAVQLVTCKQNEVEPEDWLREVIEKLNDWPSNQVHELLPWNFSSVK